jgi:hypothetical protein
MSCISKLSDPGRRGAADQIFRALARVEVAHGDPEALQHVIAEPPRRLVDNVGDQHLVAGLEDGQQGAGEGGEA